MKTNKLTLIVFIIVSKLTFSQTDSTKSEEMWDTFAGLKMFELIIAGVLIIGLFFVAYLVSREKKKK